MARGDEDMPMGVPGESGQATDLRHANIALGIFLVAYILSFVDRQILSLMVEPIKRDLGLSDLQVGLLQGLAFAMLYAVVGIPIGMLADRVSRRKIIAGGILFWSACTAMCGFAGGYLQLFVARMGVGLGEASLSPSAHSWLSDAYPPARLSRAMAIYNLGITIGGGLALLVGGAVVDMVATHGVPVLPVVGAMPTWRIAFLIVALPGLLVAGLVAFAREPARRGQTGPGPMSLGAALSHLHRHGRTFLAIYGTSVALGVMGYGLTAWYPTLLIRTFAMTAGEASLRLGLIYLVLGSLGALAGGFAAERLTLRGVRDANLRVPMILALLCAIPAACAPLMPSPVLLLLLFALLTFLFNGYFGCALAAIQLATPPRMRATGAALFLLANSLIGLSLGTAIVPLIDRAFFGGQGQIGPALAVIGLLATLIAAVAARSGLRAYAATIDALARD
ncbi:MFS family permease [Sphingobium sp. OAS761]|uniref:spinster family MFS transporter n=1 Tax=Sphingobium sp. OAS761 TaxID=2817901 RepID=UPI00209CC94B|nr:MFS transporter [Sphingobium sp. OAS761]MCP1468604.1 MFS family permease [Sphingobium sp. OAS761]